MKTSGKRWRWKSTKLGSLADDLYKAMRTPTPKPKSVRYLPLPGPMTFKKGQIVTVSMGGPSVYCQIALVKHHADGTTTVSLEEVRRPKARRKRA